jgi:hypothetical protein
MAHWAEIDENNTVVRVLTTNNADVNEGYDWLIQNLGGTWIQTSFNTRGGIHYGDDGSPALHKNYAGIGDSFDGVGFFAPQPYPSWNFNSETYYWLPPIPYPDDGKAYNWDEATLSWIEVTGTE